MNNTKLIWWFMGIIGAVLLALGGSWANGMYDAVNKVSAALEGNTKELRNIVAQQSERLVKVETYSEVQRQEMSSLRQQVTRVETKVDELGKR